MQRATGTILDEHSKPVASCPVGVYRMADLAAASLWSDNGITPVGSNVVTTNARGFYSFYARNGVYALRPAKAGYTFINSDLDAVTLYDPADASNPWTWGGRPGFLNCDFTSLYNISTTCSVSGGAVLRFPSPRQAALKTPSATVRNGWLECVSDGTAQPNTPFLAFEQIGSPTTTAFFGFVPTSPEQLLIETSLLSVGSSASVNRRFGFASGSLQTGTNPSDGIWIHQSGEGPTNQLLLVTRSASGTESTAPFLPGGASLSATVPLPLRFVITSTLVQVFALVGSAPARQTMASLTTTIPSTSVALTVLGGSTLATAGVGFAVDYVRTMLTRN
ncbi:MAG TPA: hypothetical protein VNC22_16065 [Sporichthya sp.]|jgi:hypothetical protein|nr:hypothetical protein [Sporichthya sp.]